MIFRGCVPSFVKCSVDEKVQEPRKAIQDGIFNDTNFKAQGDQSALGTSSEARFVFHKFPQMHIRKINSQEIPCSIGKFENFDVHATS